MKNTHRQEVTMSSRRQVPPVMMVGEVNYPLENILQQKRRYLITCIFTCYLTVVIW